MFLRVTMNNRFHTQKISCVFRSINFGWISTRLWNVINFPLTGVNIYLISALPDIVDFINHKNSIFYAHNCDENDFSFKTFAFSRKPNKFFTNSPFEIRVVYLSPDFPPQSQRSSFYLITWVDVSGRLCHMLDKEKRYIHGKRKAHKARIVLVTQSNTGTVIRNHSPASKHFSLRMSLYSSLSRLDDSHVIRHTFDIWLFRTVFELLEWKHKTSSGN